jgi:hypothetical protein
MRYLQGSGKPGRLKIKWYTPAFLYVDDVNIVGEVYILYREI